MKRYACNLLLVSSSVALKEQVVEIGSDGLCSVYYALDGEQPSTEWLGGIFVLLPRDIHPENEECLRTVWSRVVSNDVFIWCVWRISGVNLMNLDIDVPCYWHFLS